MYYPYLRARQFELIALRELAGEGDFKGYVTPIIEPVRESFNNLNRANGVFAENGYSPFLVVNPLQGDITGDRKWMLDYMAGLEASNFRAAFHYTNNADYIRRCIEEYSLDDCMLICLDIFEDDDALRFLCREQAITRIALLDPNKYRALGHYLKGLHDKIYIRLDDLFEKQNRNADFLNIPAHKLSEEHLYYSTEGYKGFSDFTVLPSEFIDGGITPRAVVIHLSYIDKDKNSEIWIRHFTSDSNDSIANVQGKFAEAARKALHFCDSNNLNNSAIEELRRYFTTEKYPGLGIVKKISIKNHLIIVSDFLKEHHGEGL